MADQSAISPSLGVVNQPHRLRRSLNRPINIWIRIAFEMQRPINTWVSIVIQTKLRQTLNRLINIWISSALKIQRLIKRSSVNLRCSHIQFCRLESALSGTPENTFYSAFLAEREIFGSFPLFWNTILPTAKSSCSCVGPVPLSSSPSCVCVYVIVRVCVRERESVCACVCTCVCT